MKQLSVAALVCLTACSNPASPVREAAVTERFCEEAYASILPWVSRNVRNEGQIIKGTYRVTEIPRGDGKTAFVTSGIHALIERGGTFEELVRDVGYFEDIEKCQSYEKSGTFFCYKTELGRNSSPYTSLITNNRTRAFLSVLTFFATGGEADAAAIAIAARQTAYVNFDRLLEQTSAPSGVGTWYYCQSCDAEKVQLGGPVSLSGIRFGRARDAIYFITKSGWIARLGDNATRATYARCKILRGGK